MFKPTLCCLTVAMLVLLTTMAQAQPGGCLIGDDGFASSPCCTPVLNVNLPQFPQFQQSGKYACITNCTVVDEFPVVVSTVHTPFPGICDYAFISITVLPSSTTAPGWTGILFAKYARTWLEPDPTGLPDRQVWRFLINGMLTPTSGAMPCPIPPHPVGDNTHFHGHVDYACEFDPVNPIGFSWRMALNINHLPGCISHDPIITSNPLPAAAAHNDRSYHLVTPSAFVFAPVPVPMGPTPAEAIRSTTFFGAAGYACLGEAPIIQGNINNQFQTCLCFPLVAGPFDWVHQNITGVAPCAGIAGSYASFPLPPGLPPLPTGFATMPLGMWTGAPGVFPDGRNLLLHWGVLQYFDVCNPNDFPLHIVTGLSTEGVPGIPFQNSTPPAVFGVFMDLQHSLLQNGLLGPLTIGWGDTFFSKLVWNINLPFFYWAGS
jgi:hypothetical protein